MTFLEDYDASMRPTGTTRVDAAVTVVRDWLTSRPEAMFEELREHAPTLVIGHMAFVTRFADVLDVLGRSDVFSVRPYGEAIMRLNRGPNFLLGMDDGPEYQQQLSLLRRVVHGEDAVRIRDLVTARTSEALAPALARGRLDLADGFGRLVPARFVGDYFGVPGPDAPTLMAWARTIFTDGFANGLRLPLLSRRAMRSSEAFRAYLDDLIAARAARRADAAAPRDDVLGRLLALEASGEPGLSRASIRDILLWCVAGMIDNVNTAVCHVMDYLLDHAEVMAGAADMVRAGDTGLLRRYAMEALRFRTPTPVVSRLTLREHTLSRDTPHETTIPAGTLTFAGLGVAMMDDAVVEAPRTFRLDRPSAHYLHFGAGLHQCLGIHVAAAHLTEMVGRLLTLPGLKRARGPAGRLRRLGPFPKGLVVEFASRP